MFNFIDEYKRAIEERIDAIYYKWKFYFEDKFEIFNKYLIKKVAYVIMEYWRFSKAYGFPLSEKINKIKMIVRYRQRYPQTKAGKFFHKVYFNSKLIFNLNPYFKYIRNTFYFSKYVFITLTRPKIWITNAKYYSKRSKYIIYCIELFRKTQQSLINFVYFLDNYLLAHEGRKVDSSFGGLISSRRFFLVTLFCVYLAVVVGYMVYLLAFICYYNLVLANYIPPVKEIVETFNDRGLELLDSKESLQDVVRSRIRVLQHLTYPRFRDCMPPDPNLLINSADIVGHLYEDLFPEEIEDNIYRVKQIGCYNFGRDPNYEPKSKLMKFIKENFANDSDFYLNKNSHLNHIVFED